ncbi:YY1-associated factor 2 isoform X3 [Carcharodon carcharias]|uniref:YY1-associated factor 2 isoform X3 n=1 Tax=Carcharodon carcharias TaxID=13397 RepID=UPI001B7DEABD|nr:YY1-associated factor 2 isoform X3 [Carcharodon carcharias]
MGDKKSPTRPKRQPKPSTDEGYWDCSVCTFKNSAEAFKCSMCDVRKGTSTRPCYGRTAKQSGCQSPSQGKPPVSITTSKSHPGRPTRSNPSSMKPRPVSQLVAQQVTQQFASPTQPKKEKKEKGEKEKNEKETVSKKNSHKKTRRKLLGPNKTITCSYVRSGWITSRAGLAVKRNTSGHASIILDQKYFCNKIIFPGFFPGRD